MTGGVLDKDIIISRERDGHVIVYRRAGTKPDSNLHYRMRIPNIHNKYERRTTGTPDEVEAIQIARGRYDELRERQRRKVTVFSKTFGNLAEAYLVDLGHRLKIGAKGVSQSVYDLADWTIKSYFVPFWDKKEVDTFTGTDVAALHKWRMEQWETNKDKVRNVSHGLGFKRRFKNASIKRPSAQSQARDEGVFNQIMRYGVVNRWLTLAELPTYDRTKPDKKRRAGFEDDEFERLEKYLATRILEAENGSFRDRVNPRIVHQRALLYNFVMFLAHSGLRVGECRNLRIKDVKLIGDGDWFVPQSTAKEMLGDGVVTVEEAEALYGEVVNVDDYFEESGDVDDYWDSYDGREVLISVRNGKTGSRYVTGQRELIDIRNAAFVNHPDRKPDSLLWVNRKGQHVKSFKETFAVILNDLDLRIAKDGINEGGRRSLYSLRHFYATTRLRDGVDIYLLAKNMGTSVKQIETYYSHILIEREARRIIDPSGFHKNKKGD